MFKSLRSKILFYFIIILVCIAMGIISIVLLNAKKAIKNDLVDKHSIVSQQAYHVISATLERSFGDVAMLSSNAVLRSADTTVAEKKQELIRLKEILRLYEDISILDGNGRIITSTDYSFRGQPQYQPYFKKAVQGKITMSNVRAIPDPFKIVLNFAGPMYDSKGQFAYVVSIQLNMDMIWKLVDDIKIGDTGFLYIANDKQIIVGSEDNALLLSNLPKGLVDALGSDEPLLQYETSEGSVLGAYYTPNPPGSLSPGKQISPFHQRFNWMVFSLQQQSEAYGILYSFIAQVLLFSIVALVGVIILGIGYSYSLTKPLVQLTRSTEAIGKGQWDQITEISTTDEIGQLAKSFQTMAAQIKNMTAYIHDIVNSMPSIIIGVDTEAYVTLWNSEAARFTTLLSEQAEGKQLFEVFPLLVSETEKIVEAINTQTVQRHPRMLFEKEGVKEYFEVTVYPLHAQNHGAVIRVDNITPRIRMEETIVQTEKMMSLGGLAAGMAHEINNPLSGISQNAQVLRQRLWDELPKNVSAAAQSGTNLDVIRSYCSNRGLDEIVNAISLSTQRAASIVGNMLSFSRKSTALKSTCDLAELIDETVDLISNDYSLKKRQDFKNIKIVKEYAEPHPRVACVRNQIQQVIFNLLKNGAEAMTSEPSKEETPCFNIRLYERNDQVCIDISDNGIGIPEGIQKRIFEPFFTTKGVGEGTGLGLSVSYFIVTDKHHGTLRLKSTEGQGTQFFIELPKTTNT